jgi:cytidine deaminase
MTASEQLTHEQLVNLALQAREKAYTPYSQFNVGAAVLTRSGKVFLGCNIENASFPAGICAERVAISGAYAAGERDIVAIAVVGDTPHPITPCGICRQVILELAPDCDVLMANTAGDISVSKPRILLPGGFTSDSLSERETE